MSTAYLVLSVAALMLVGVPMVRWIIDRPQRGLLTLAALTPLHGVVAILPMSGVLTAWKEGVLAVTIAAAFARRPRRHAASAVPVQLPWWPLLFGFIALGVASALLAFGWFGLLAIKVTFFYTLVLVALWFAPFDARDRDRLVTLIMALGVLVSVAGLVQRVLGPDRMIALGYQYGMQVRGAGGVFRTFSTFNQPFGFALFVMLALLVGGAVALAEPGRTRNRLFLLATPLMVVAMTTAVVRAAILGLVIGLLWLAIYRFRRLTWLFAGAGALVVLVLPFLPARFLTALTSSSSFGERTDRWDGVIDSIATSPFGRGLGASGSAADKIATAEGEDLGVLSPKYQPDNYYMKILFELGPIGLWIVGGLLLVALVWTTRLARGLPGRDGALAAGVGASTVAAMAASLVATYFEIFPLDFYFWLLLGVIGCAAAQHGSVSAHWRSGREAAACRPTPVSSSPPCPESSPTPS